MKTLNKYDYFLLAGLALWLAETWAFGWNETAQSVPEKMLDAVSLFLVLYGFIGGVAAAVKTEIHLYMSAEGIKVKQKNHEQENERAED